MPPEFPSDVTRGHVDSVHGIEVARAEDDAPVAVVLDRVHMDDIGILITPVHVLRGHVDVFGRVPLPYDLVRRIQFHD